MTQKNISCIVGARPNFMKIAPLMVEFARHPALDAKLIHTGQHFSPEMSDVFFHDLGLAQPDEYLGVAAGSQIEQTASIMGRTRKLVSPRKSGSRGSCG